MRYYLYHSYLLGELISKKIHYLFEHDIKKKQHIFNEIK